MTICTGRYTSVAIILLSVIFSAQAAQEGDTTTVTVSGTLIDTPDCTINNNNQIDVDFGEDVIISRIDGVNYKRTPIPFDLVCFSLAKQGLTIAIDGAPSPLNPQVIDTSVEGLGIQVFLDPALPLYRGTVISFNYGDSFLNFSAAPIVLGGATLSAQPFTGTGTVVLGYQ